MGRVFTWQEIASGDIPQEENFEILQMQIVGLINGCHAICGGLFFGSGAYSQTTARSDLDVLVVYDENKSYEAEKCFGAMYEWAARSHIPLELVAIDTKLARSNLHSIRPSMYAHLSSELVLRTIVKENPLRFISQSPNEDRWADVAEYLRFKLEKLNKGLNALHVLPPEDLCRLLQKALESPIHIARKMLWRGHQLGDDRKRAVVGKYMEVFDGTPLPQKLFQLVQADACYSSLFRDGECSLSEAAYEKTIGSFKAVVGDAFVFARDNALLLDSLPH